MTDEELFEYVLKMHEQNPKAYELWVKGKSSLGFAMGQTMKLIGENCGGTVPADLNIFKLQEMIQELWKDLVKKPV